MINTRINPYNIIFAQQIKVPVVFYHDVFTHLTQLMQIAHALFCNYFPQQILFLLIDSICKWTSLQFLKTKHSCTLLVAIRRSSI